jgi:hypothetical protein
MVLGYPEIASEFHTVLNRLTETPLGNETGDKAESAGRRIFTRIMGGL